MIQHFSTSFFYDIVITQMLQKDKGVRLGVKNDFKDIKGHMFFSSINWNLLDERKMKPPYNPNVVRINNSILCLMLFVSIVLVFISLTLLREGMIYKPCLSCLSMGREGDLRIGTIIKALCFSPSTASIVHFCFQSGQMDLKHFDPEFVREPVPGRLNQFWFPFFYMHVHCMLDCISRQDTHYLAGVKVKDGAALLDPPPSPRPSGQPSFPIYIFLLQKL